MFSKYNKITLLFICLFFISTGGIAQITVRKASGNASNGNAPGFYYALPRTCMKIDVRVVKTVNIPGPYASYAEKYLGLENVNSYQNSSYEIAKVKVNSFLRPDPEQYYFVEYGELAVKEEESLKLSLTQAGLLVAINQTEEVKNLDKVIFDVESDVESLDDFFEKSAVYNLYEKIDTTTRRIAIDTLIIERHFYNSTWTEKSSDQKAQEAAEFISRIRENRFLLLSGYQEVNYGESIEYMDKKLAELETEYLSLFTGVTKKSSYDYSFILVPDPEMKQGRQAVFKFSPDRGIGELSSSGGNIVYLNYSPAGTPLEIEQFTSGKNRTTNSANAFYYRIPEYSDISIAYNNEVYYKSNLLINQFGVVVMSPLYNAIVNFHPETGGLKSLDLEVKDK